MKWRKVEVGVTWDESTFETMEDFPRDPGSPKLRMGAWNLNTFCFGDDFSHPESSSSDVRWARIPRDLGVSLNGGTPKTPKNDHF